MYYYILDNEINGFSFFRLKEEDIKTMFPGKIGLIKRVTCLLAEAKGLVDNTVSIVNDY